MKWELSLGFHTVTSTGQEACSTEVFQTPGPQQCVPPANLCNSWALGSGLWASCQERQPRKEGIQPSRLERVRREPVWDYERHLARNTQRGQVLWKSYLRGMTADLGTEGEWSSHQPDKEVRRCPGCPREKDRWGETLREQETPRTASVPEDKGERSLS